MSWFKLRSLASCCVVIHQLCRVAVGGQPFYTCHISGPRPHPSGDQEWRDLRGGQERPHHSAGPGKITIIITLETCHKSNNKIHQMPPVLHLCALSFFRSSSNKDHKEARYNIVSSPNSHRRGCLIMRLCNGI